MLSSLENELPLSNKKLVLQTFTKDCLIPEYIDWLNDKEVTKYSNQRFFTHTFESAKKYFDQMLTNPDAHFVAIKNNDSGEILGTATVYFQPYHSTADIGIMIGNKRYWGKGLATDTMELLSNCLINKLKIRKVTAGTLSCNIGMIRALEKSGFKCEATRRNQEVVNGQEQDIVYFAKFQS